MGKTILPTIKPKAGVVLTRNNIKQLVFYCNCYELFLFPHNDGHQFIHQEQNRKLYHEND